MDPRPLRSPRQTQDAVLAPDPAMRPVVTLTANPLLDCVAELSTSLRPGATHRVARFTLAAGGKGINAGRVLAALGHPVRTVAFAGGETGAHFAHQLRIDGLEPWLVSTAARTRIGFEAVAPSGGATAVFEDGFEVTPAEQDRLLQVLEEALVGAPLLIAAGSVPCPACEPLYERVLALAARLGVPCWLDAWGPSAERALRGVHLPQLAKPNRQEYEAIAGFQRIPELHLTDGARPVEVSRDGHRWRVTPPSVTERNAIGSGDSYLGALAHARLTGRAFEAQLAWAVAAGAANAKRSDVARVGASEIEALVAQARVEALAPG